MRVVQINTTVNTGSTGRIAEDLGKVLLAGGHESIVAYGGRMQPSASQLLRIGNGVDRRWHVLQTRLLDAHGFASKRATRSFLQQLDRLQPDLVHLHNLHGYYLQVEMLSDWLKDKGLPVVWTFHDCWPFTGHCSYFDRYACLRWQSHCHHCPNTHGYPKSWGLDRSFSNFERKRSAFQGIDRMVLVAPSQWLGRHLQTSFLQDYPLEVIPNGIDLGAFCPTDAKATAQKYGLENKKIVLGVAGQWDRRKGLGDFLALRTLLPEEVEIVLVGLQAHQLKSLPRGVRGLERTENLGELAALYSLASVFVNPTYIDNFPTTNLEALACGTPVLTYRTGGSPEALNPAWNGVVARGDVAGLAARIVEVLTASATLRSEYRLWAQRYFDKEDSMAAYVDLYQRLRMSTSGSPFLPNTNALVNGEH